jgi:hypothetical protein
MAYCRFYICRRHSPVDQKRDPQEQHDPSARKIHHGWHPIREPIDIVNLAEGLGREKSKYLKWLLAQSVAPKTKIESVITEDALSMLSERLSTPLQLEY